MTNITIEKLQSVGGQIVTVNADLKTGFYPLDKFIKEKELPCKEGDKLLYILYSNLSKFQIIYKINEDNTLILLYNNIV